MSVTPSISFTLTGRKLDIDTILDAFRCTLWSLDINGSIVYLPSGESTIFNWRKAPSTSEKEVRIILAEKERQGEMIGVATVLKDSDIGGNVLWDARTDILNFMPVRNRQLLSNGRTTDFSWYLERILPLLEQFGAHAEFVECRDWDEGRD